MKGKNTNERISLVPLGERHLAQTLVWVSDPRIAEGMNLVPPSNAEEHRNWFERLKGDGFRRYFAIEQENGHVGNCGLKDINTDGRSRHAELWIYVAPEHQRQGIGEKATRELLSVAFRELKLHRVFLYALESNRRAIALYRKLGFKEEGKFRDHIFLNGTFYNAVYLGILEEEFQTT